MKPTYFIIIAATIFAGCNHSTQNIVCAHPFVMGGMPFRVPPGGYFNRYGALVLPLEDGVTALTSPQCVIREGEGTNE